MCRSLLIPVSDQPGHIRFSDVEQGIKFLYIRIGTIVFVNRLTHLPDQFRVPMKVRIVRKKV